MSKSDETFVNILLSCLLLCVWSHYTNTSEETDDEIIQKDPNFQED